MHRALTHIEIKNCHNGISRWTKSTLGGRVGALERPWQQSELMEIKVPSSFITTCACHALVYMRV